METTETQTITVGTAIAAAGTTVRGAIPVTTLAGGSALEIPVIVINGATAGPCLWIDAAIHGDEPEGTLTCQSLARQISPDRLAGTLVLIPAMNVPAYEAGQRGNPLDTFSYDMNRIYPGRANGYLTERMAWAHSQWMTKVADLEISIHSGGAHSYLSQTIFVNEDDKSVELAKAMGRGWELVLSAISPKGNPMAVMLEAGKTGITVELGGRCRHLARGNDPQVVGVLTEAMLNVMRHYGMLEGERPTIRPCAGEGVQEALLAPVKRPVRARPRRRHARSPMKQGRSRSRSIARHLG